MTAPDIFITAWPQCTPCRDTMGHDAFVSGLVWLVVDKLLQQGAKPMFGGQIVDGGAPRW